MFDYKPMEIAHVEQIAEIEKRCFKTPWSVESFKNELENQLAHYIVVENCGEVVAYLGFYRILDEGHITNIAVKPEYQGRHIASELLSYALEQMRGLDILRVTLEVNENNFKAKSLYEAFRFKLAGRRAKYYEGVDDALIYWLEL